MGLNDWLPTENRTFFGTNRDIREFVVYYPRSNRIKIISGFRIVPWIDKRLKRGTLVVLLGEL